jgi:hypothetical protein
MISPVNAASYVNNIQQAQPSQTPPPVKQLATTPQDTPRDTVVLSSAAQAAAENK